MKNYIIFIISFLMATYSVAGLCFSEVPANSAIEFKTQDLSTIIENAYENNFKLKSIQNMIDALLSKADFSGSLLDPVVGFALANVPTDDFKLDKEPMTQKQVFIAQKFPWPGKRASRKNITLYEAEILKETLKKEKLKIARITTTLYYELGYLNRALETNTKLIDRITNVKNVAIAIYRSGKGMQHSIFQAEVSIGTLRDERFSILNKIMTKKLKINEILNSGVFADIKPPILPGFKNVSLDFKKITAIALRNNPDVNTILQQIKKRKSQIKLAEKDYFPDTTLKLAYGQREDDRVDIVSVVASFNLPLYKNKRQNSFLYFNKKQNKSNENTYNYVTTVLPYKIESLVEQIHEICNQHRLYEDTIIPQAEKWAESSLSDYKVGKINFNTMISAHIKELKYKLKKEKYQFDILIKAAELQELAGENI